MPEPPPLKIERDLSRAVDTTVDLSRNKLEAPQPKVEVEAPQPDPPKLQPSNISKITTKGEKLQRVLELRRKLLAAEPLELVIGSGGLAQSITFTPKFEVVVRQRMITDLTADAETLAEELRQFGVPVDLPI